jgi:hypothetical protein
MEGCLGIVFGYRLVTGVVIGVAAAISFVVRAEDLFILAVGRQAQLIVIMGLRGVVKQAYQMVGAVFAIPDIGDD